MKEILVCSRFRIHCYVAAPFTLLVGSLDLLQFSLLFCDQRYLREREKSLLQLQSIILAHPGEPLRCFIKAHTCFNRLDIPLYKTKGDLEINLRAIINQERFYFDFE